MTTVLITGVAGFIGGNFAHYMARTYPDYKLVGLDSLSPYSCRESLTDLERSGKLAFFKGDIVDSAVMESLYREQRIDLVVNFAAESHNDRAILDPGLFARSNALGAQTLLEVSRRVGVTRHVHVSTIEVYGEQGPGIDSFTEGTPLNAKTPYAAAKAAGDLLVRAYMHTYREMDIALTHCANNYGPYQFPEKLIPLCLTNLLRGRKAPIYGDGLQIRDWLHVVDHCRAIDLILHRKGRFEVPEEAKVRPELLPIFDISARQEVTNREIVGRIIKELGRDPNEWIEYVADRPNHDRRYSIDPGKIERELGFRASVDIARGIAETVRWYVENEPWWDAILQRSPKLQIDWQKTAVRGKA
jgi:dTDP-glucose 4,6-dehydratase